MAIHSIPSLLMINIFFIICGSHGKPSKIVSILGNDLVVVDSGSGVPNSVEVQNGAVRVQRSPQFGLLDDDDFGDYSDDPEGRHLHKRKHKRPHRKPHGGFGCRRKHGCGGWQGGHYPEYGGHYPVHQQFGQGGSFATASAGSSNGGHYGGFGGNNQANAQSASFNFGPFSFSVAQAGAGQGSQGFF